jgi:hypothetical protein
MPSALDDVLSDVRRQQLVADDAVDHGADVSLCQTVDRQRGHMRLSDPGRLELRPERHDQQHAKARDPVHRATERFQAGGVAPVRILEDHEHGAGARQGFQLYAECCKRFLPALFGNRLQSGVASVVGKRQHLGQQRRVLPGCRGLRQQRIELVELCLRCVAVCKSGGTFELPDDRIKSAVRVLGRAEITQPRVGFGREALHERGGEPGFADPGLTG